MPTQADQHSANIKYLPEQAELVCSGNWTINDIDTIESDIRSLANKITQSIVINAEAMKNVDSAGAMLLFDLIVTLDKQGKRVKSAHLNPECRSLLELIHDQQKDAFHKMKPKLLPNFLYILGKRTIEKFSECTKFITFIGHFADSVVHLVRNLRHPPWQAVLSTVDEAGYQALPIVGLLTFLVGVVVTFQIALQLVTYGANIYIVDLTGMIIFREFGPLITAIIASGRTSTAFTAQIGTMKVNEELDALSTMGVSPMERLVVPKVIGLLIALPLLTVWADVFGILGAMFMAKAKLSVSFYSFFQRFQHVIEVRQFIVGLVKVPVFALIIALVGCFQGFQVGSSADSVGRKTTKAAVQSIFLIIIADAIFSIIFSIRGI